MKNIKEHYIMKYLKHLFLLVLLVSIGVACDDNPDEFPVDTDELIDPDNTGGFVRIVSVESGAFNVFDLDNSEFGITIEVDDAENGGQMESVEFFVTYKDNALQTAGDSDKVALFTLEPSDFTVNEESGLPRTSVTISANEAIAATGISASDVGVEDSFDFEWTLNMTNGNSFNADNSGQNIRGGAFFNSPFFQSVPVGVAIPQDSFVGTYTMSQDAPTTSGTAAAFAGGLVFDDDGDLDITVELAIDPNNTLSGRTFSAAYLAALGFGPGNYSFNLSIDPFTGNNVVNWPDQGTGLACSSGIVLGEPETRGTYDIDDDSEFTIRFVDDPTQDCGAGSQEVQFTLTKQ